MFLVSVSAQRSQEWLEEKIVKVLVTHVKNGMIFIPLCNSYDFPYAIQFRQLNWYLLSWCYLFYYFSYLLWIFWQCHSWTNDMKDKYLLSTIIIMKSFCSKLTTTCSMWLTQSGSKRIYTHAILVGDCGWIYLTRLFWMKSLMRIRYKSKSIFIPYFVCCFAHYGIIF